MRYMLLIYVDEHASAARSAAEIRATTALHAPYIEMLRRNAQYLASDPLGPARSALTLRSSGGKPIVTDGPFAECREQLGGFYLIEAHDLDQAISAAARCPALETVAVAIEIRPIAGAGRVQEPSPPSPEKTSRYLLVIYRQETTPDGPCGSQHSECRDDDDRQAALDQWDRCVRQLRASGRLADAQPLAPSGSATTVRLRDGKLNLTDGPFAETAEQICGCCIVWAQDIDDAVSLAAAWPEIRSHAIEIRAVRSAGG
jgi:hypothetical protein